MDCQTAESMVIGYINRTISPQELEPFLRHMEECPSCREELETYYTVKWAMDQLQNEEDSLLDVRKLLEQDLKKSWRIVYRMKLLRFLKITTVFLLAAVLMAVALLLIFELRG